VRFVEVRAAAQEGHVVKAVGQRHVALIGAPQFIEGEMARVKSAREAGSSLRNAR